MNVMTRPDRRKGIFFVTDVGFALPTLASALEVRKKVPVESADIRIITISIHKDMVCRMMDVVGPAGIQMDVLEHSSFAAFDHRAYNKTHVPMAALGRFFMLDAVPDIYDRVLYLDGDTWPVGDPLKLLEAELPDGAIGAAEDRNYFRRHEMGPVGRKTRAYFSGLGIDGNSGYFSSGVLVADSKTWHEVSAEAFAFFAENTARCLYHDQSALNAVAGSRWARLAPQWNFASSYMEWGLKCHASPQILHFSGGDKPWAVPFHPYHTVYTTAFEPLRELGLPIKQYTPEQLKALERRAQLRKIRDGLFLHRRIMYQNTFDRLVKASAVG